MDWSVGLKGPVGRSGLLGRLDASGLAPPRRSTLLGAKAIRRDSDHRKRHGYAEGIPASRSGDSFT